MHASTLQQDANKSVMMLTTNNVVADNVEARVRFGEMTSQELGGRETAPCPTPLVCSSKDNNAHDVNPIPARLLVSMIASTVRSLHDPPGSVRSSFLRVKKITTPSKK